MGTDRTTVATAQTDLLKADLGRVLMRREALQEEAITKTLETAPAGPQIVGSAA